MASKGSAEAASRYLAPDVTLEAKGEPPTVGRDGWLARQTMFEQSFGDLAESPIIDRVEGNIVHGRNSVTGTHTGDLDLTAAGLGVIAATNRRASLEVHVAWTVDGDRITAMAARSPDGPLIPIVLGQLGVELPGQG